MQVFGTNVMVTVAKSFDAPIKRKFTLDCFIFHFFITAQYEDL